MTNDDRTCATPRTGNPTTSHAVVGATLTWLAILPALAAHLLLALHLHGPSRGAALAAAWLADRGAVLLGERPVYVAEYRRHVARRDAS